MKTKAYRVNVQNIKTVEDVAAILMVLNPVVTMPDPKLQGEIEESGLFVECCIKCGIENPETVPDAPVSLCTKCFEAEKSSAIKKKIVS